jgi:hypothetical protein
MPESGVAAVSMQRKRQAHLAAGAAALAVALGSLAIAEGPGGETTYAGSSGFAATLMVAAGVTLILAGLVTSFFGQVGRIGDLAVLTGLVWFAPIWVGWDNGPPWVRSIGMLAAGFVIPLLMHLILAAPSGGLRSTAAQVLIVTVYLEAALAALALALVRDPFFDPNCWANCTDNLFLLRSLPGMARWIESAHQWFSAAAAVAMVIIIALELITDTRPARRTQLPFAAPAILLSGAVLAHALALQRTPREDPADSTFRTIFIVECAAVLSLQPDWPGPRSVRGCSAVPSLRSSQTWVRRHRRDLCRRHSPKLSVIPNSRSPIGCPIRNVTWALPDSRSPSRRPQQGED